MADLNDPHSIVIFAPTYEDVNITVPASGVIAAGTLLARDTITERFVMHTIGGVTNGRASAVMPIALVAQPGDTTARVLVAGRVRRHELTTQGGPVEGPVVDALRSYGIDALYVQQLYKFDNVAIPVDYNVSDGLGGFEGYNVSDGLGGFEQYAVQSV